MFDNDEYQKLLIEDLINAEALQGRYYTIPDFVKKFSHVQSQDYDWPKNFNPNHKIYYKTRFNRKLFNLRDAGFFTVREMKIDNKFSSYMIPNDLREVR